MAVGKLYDKRNLVIDFLLCHIFGTEINKFFGTKKNRYISVFKRFVERLSEVVLSVNDFTFDSGKAHTRLCINIIAEQVKLHSKFHCLSVRISVSRIPADGGGAAYFLTGRE